MRCELLSLAFLLTPVTAHKLNKQTVRYQLNSKWQNDKPLFSNESQTFDEKGSGYFRDW